MTVVDTRPFCGSCGWDPTRSHIYDDVFCNACGADLRRFNFGSSAPPPPPIATPGVGEVSFTWVEEPVLFPEGYDFRYSFAGGPHIVIQHATSPQVIATAPGVEACGSLAGRLYGVPTEWGDDGCATATA